MLIISTFYLSYIYNYIIFKTLTSFMLLIPLLAKRLNDYLEDISNLINIKI